MRLDKALTLAGLTRSQARKAAAEGRARVDGVVVRDAAASVKPEQVTLDVQAHEIAQILCSEGNDVQLKDGKLTIGLKANDEAIAVLLK